MAHRAHGPRHLRCQLPRHDVRALLANFSGEALQLFATFQRRPVSTLRDGFMRERKQLSVEEGKVLRKVLALDAAHKSIRHLTNETCSDLLGQLHGVLLRQHDRGLPLDPPVLPSLAGALRHEILLPQHLQQQHVHDLVLEDLPCQSSESSLPQYTTAPHDVGPTVLGVLPQASIGLSSLPSSPTPPTQEPVPSPTSPTSWPSSPRAPWEGWQQHELLDTAKDQHEQDARATEEPFLLLNTAKVQLELDHGSTEETRDTGNTSSCIATASSLGRFKPDDTGSVRGPANSTRQRRILNMRCHLARTAQAPTEPASTDGRQAGEQPLQAQPAVRKLASARQRDRGSVLTPAVRRSYAALRRDAAAHDGDATCSSSLVLP